MWCKIYFCEGGEDCWALENFILLTCLIYHLGIYTCQENVIFAKKFFNMTWFVFAAPDIPEKIKMEAEVTPNIKMEVTNDDFEDFEFEDPPDDQKNVIKEEYDETKYQEMEKISADSTEEDGWTTVKKERKSADELNTPSTKTLVQPQNGND